MARTHGTGSLTVRTDTAGRGTWYGLWWSAGRRVKRKLGPVRTPERRDGLTQRQAEAALRKLMAEAEPARAPGTRMPFGELTRRYLNHLAVTGRKPSTIRDVEGHIEHWLAPHFGDTDVNRIAIEDVERLVLAMRQGRRPSGIVRAKPPGPKTIRNIIGNLAGMLAFAERKGWSRGNPARAVDLPKTPSSDEIRWLEPEEVHALARAATDPVYGHLDRAMYVTAAMTGLRQGELIALRWRDVDWLAGAVRVRRNHVRGIDGTPKSRRSSRSVPMADDVAAALEVLSQQVASGEDDLVFADPVTGAELKPHSILRRMRTALASARLDVSHVFHDLRHTFGTRMASRGVPMRTLQEWMGHASITTTQRYADYAPRHDERALVQAAFAPRGSVRGSDLTRSEVTSPNLSDDATSGAGG